MSSCTQDPSQWFCYGISQGYGTNGELGNDVATPYHTPITALYGGTIISDTYQPWGGQVGIRAYVPGYGYLNEYFLHLDSLANLQVGQSVSAGQFLGLSGGQNVGGNHPVPPQYSSGPHTEFGFGAPWIGGGPNVNSIFALNEARSGQLTGTGTGNGGGSNGGSSGGGLGNFPWCTLNPTLPGCTAGPGTPGSPNPLGGLFAIDIPNPLCMLDSNLPGCNGNIFGTPQINWLDVGIRALLIVVGAILVIVGMAKLVSGTSTQAVEEETQPTQQQAQPVQEEKPKQEEAKPEASEAEAEEVAA